ncbi:MAG: hypothetical protein QFX35_01820 [Candidatus Verstraetearchaeota archaeon]|nr:hypothetical protein [Candidatus Verstraetearchaeota archaeon]
MKGISTLAVAALLVLFLVQTAFPVVEGDQGGGGQGQGRIRHEGSDMELYYTIQTALSFANSVLSTLLLGAYLDTYRRIRSEISLSLVVVSIVFLFHSLASNPLLHSAFGFGGYGLGPFAMLPELFSFVALSILVYISMK